MGKPELLSLHCISVLRGDVFCLTSVHIPLSARQWGNKNRGLLSPHKAPSGFQMLPLLFWFGFWFWFLATLAACESSGTRDGTCATAAPLATEVTTLTTLSHQGIPRCFLCSFLETLLGRCVYAHFSAGQTEALEEKGLSRAERAHGMWEHRRVALGVPAQNPSSPYR